MRGVAEGKLVLKHGRRGLLKSIPTASAARDRQDASAEADPRRPSASSRDAENHVKRIYAHTEDHKIELNLYIRGEEGDEAAAGEPEPDEVGTT